MPSVTLPAIGATTAAAAGGTAAAAGTAAAVGAGTAAAVAGTSTLATIATGLTAAAAVGSLGLTLSNVLGAGGKKLPTLAMPNPNDPALLNQQKTMLALAAGKGGRSGSDLGGARGGGSTDYSNTVAGSG